MAAIIIISFLSLQTTVFADNNKLEKAEFSQQSVTADKNANTFSLDITVINNAPFSGAEFGLELKGSLKIKSVEYSDKTANKAGVTEKAGVYYFGFFSDANKYNGKVTIGKVTFEYTGNADAQITMNEASVITISNDKNAVSEKIFPKTAVQVKRDTSTDSGNGGNPNPYPNPNPNPNPSDPSPPKPTGEKRLEIDAAAINDAISHAHTDKHGIQVLTFDLNKSAGQADSLTIAFPATLLNTTVKRKVILETPIAYVALPANVIASQQLGGAANIELHISRIDNAGLLESVKTRIGAHPVIDMYFTLDGKKIAWKNADKPVTVSIPYSPNQIESKNLDLLVVYYIDSNNKLQIVSNGNYHSADGKVTFTAPHLGQFALAFLQKTFEDIQTSWAKKEIEALAVRNIITGTSEKTFSPQKNITRADFIKMLVGVLGKTEQAASGFQDVSPSDYYFEAVSTAKAIGLAGGTGDNKFNPKAQITRQEMMVLLDRALAISGEQLTEKASLAAFADRDRVSGYAKDSVSKLIASGIIQGSSGKLRPQDHLTRAESARVLQLVYKLLY